MAAQADPFERLRDLVAREHDQALVEKAADLGLVTREAAAQALREMAGRATGIAWLIERGLLRGADVARLEEAVAREDFVRAAPTASGDAPSEVIAAAADPTRHLAEFVLVERLGRGGAGDVWKAWDRSLGRWVAIKVPSIPIDSPVLRERFEREAQATARLQHPGILALHRAGTHEGRPYLVMPFVKGRSLAAMDLPLPWRQAARLMREAALAIQHAHESGFVHRDVKPGNIMVDESERAIVLDFGLVYLREQEGAKATTPGEALGTAAYMSPEQARGLPAGRQPPTDVYGLGATLYHVATGRAPFSGESFAPILSQVVHDDPLPPGKAKTDLPRDLETVIQKAMAKEIPRRYASAAELAEDLRRVLDGESIAARPAGPVSRTLLRVRRRPTGVIVGAALAVVVALLVAGRHYLRTERQASVAAIRETARLSLDAALRLRRSGDVTGMRSFMPQLEAAYRAALERAPELAEVEYLMGRMHRALLDERSAMRFFDRALDKDPSFAPALYQRAVLLSRWYGPALTGKSPGGAFAPRALTAAAAAALLRTRADLVADLRRLETLSQDGNDTLAVRGMLALHDGNYDEADRLLREVVEKDPLREEAWEHLALAAVARRRWADAEAIYAQGLARDKGYVPYYLARCRTRLDSGDYAGAIADGEAAVALLPSSDRALLCRAGGRALLARSLSIQGRDPTAEVRAALPDLALAQKMDPVWGEAENLASTVHRILAEHQLRTGVDPTDELDRAESFTPAFLARAPSARGHRGQARALRAQHHLLVGADPLPAIAAALDDLDAWVAATPNEFEPLQARGRAHALRARTALETGADPSEPIAVAERDLLASLRLLESGFSRLHLGGLYALQGEALARANKDPRAAWARAQAELDRAIAALPSILDPRIARGALATVRCVFLGRKDARAARRACAESEADLNHALERDPQRADVWAALARLHAARGDKFLHHTEAALRRALEINRFLTRELDRDLDRAHQLVHAGKRKRRAGR